MTKRYIVRYCDRVFMYGAWDTKTMRFVGYLWHSPSQAQAVADRLNEAQS